MVQRRKLLAALTRARLAELAAHFGIPGLSGKSKDAIVRAIAGARTVKTADLLASLGRDELKALCRAFGLDEGGRDKQSLIARLAGNVARTRRVRSSNETRTRRVRSSNETRTRRVRRGSNRPCENQEGGTQRVLPTSGSSSRNRSMAKKLSDDKRPIEQYEHADKTRVNNPPVGLVTPATDPDLPKKTYQYDPHLDPQLIWAGKAEHTSFEVPTVSLHVHERIDPRTIIRAVQKRNGDSGGPRQLSLFEGPEENPPLREAIEFYKHAQGWTNRLVAGDSLMVMNSLLEKEGMAGKVQMVYIDPPYGIKYGSNFQPFVNQRDVKDGKDEDLTQEPEMIQAFRDIWELGIHSYLTSLRDRLLLARELLHESGSCFVQIGDQNEHLLRQLLDEVFGRGNLCSLITFVKTTSATTTRLAGVCDYLLWYAKDVGRLKYRQLYLEKTIGAEGASKYTSVLFPDGSTRPMSQTEKSTPDGLPEGARIFTTGGLTSQSPGSRYTVRFREKDYYPSDGYWKTDEPRMENLVAAQRVVVSGNRLRYVRYFDDFPAFPLTNVWMDIGGIQSRADPKVFVVQTATSAIQRCVLMTTDPGDVVFDPTCGSGTTACVAEEWGRRWITCDTSRVAIALAKQRLMTALFDYYQLARPSPSMRSRRRCTTSQRWTARRFASLGHLRSRPFPRRRFGRSVKSMLTSSPYPAHAVCRACRTQRVRRTMRLLVMARRCGRSRRASTRTAHGVCLLHCMKSRFTGSTTTTRALGPSNRATPRRSPFGCSTPTTTAGACFPARSSSPWPAPRTAGRDWRRTSRLRSTRT